MGIIVSNRVAIDDGVFANVHDVAIVVVSPVGLLLLRLCQLLFLL